MEAIQLAEKAVDLTARRDARMLELLADVYFAAGRVADAEREIAYASREARRGNDETEAVRMERKRAGWTGGRSEHRTPNIERRTSN